MLRVLHILSGDLWAGAEVMAFQLLQCLSSSHEIKLTVILLNNGRLADELRSTGIDVEIIDENQHSFWGLALAIRSSLAADPPDIILHLAFYGLAGYGLLKPEALDRTIVKNPLYFLAVNAAILVAWYKYITGNRMVMWTPSSR